jgi:hypothetical protein
MTPASAVGARPRDLLVVAAVALALRLAVVAWAAPRVGLTGDATLYEPLALRLASGLGYTWAWPGGEVTYVAHYPVGYPALVAVAYALGVGRTGAMVLNALFGAGAAVGACALAGRASSRRGLVAGLLVGVHPGLVFYTPALMTETVAGALLVGAACVAGSRRADGRAGGSVAVGIVLGAATLVRPASLLFAPLFGAWPGRASPRRAALGAALATAFALSVCAPWTARNCERMHRCALVSLNGGWNLLIGTYASAHGGWAPLVPPASCPPELDEAAKDLCFERAARDEIAAHPLPWLALAWRKVSATFDYVGAAGWYLHDAAPRAFGDGDKLALGVVETVFERLVLLAALAAAAARDGPRTRARRAVGLVGAAFAFVQPGWVAYLALALASSLRGRALLRDAWLATAAPVAVALIASTHAVFFGGGRYALVVLPLVTALAALAPPRAAVLEDARTPRL